jgi:hypothetical protein
MLLSGKDTHLSGTALTRAGFNLYRSSKPHPKAAVTAQAGWRGK